MFNLPDWRLFHWDIRKRIVDPSEDTNARLDILFPYQHNNLKRKNEIEIIERWFNKSSEFKSSQFVSIVFEFQSLHNTKKIC